MGTKQLTLEQVYEMFGGNEKSLNLEEVFDILLCSIVEIGYFDSCNLASSMDDTMYQKFMHFYPKIKEVKNVLPKYLEVNVSIHEAKKLDELMLVMKEETDKYRSVPWYKILAKLYAKQIYKKTADMTVPIEEVFRLLEYRAVYRCNMSVADLHKRFYEYAEKFSNRLF